MKINQTKIQRRAARRREKRTRLEKISLYYDKIEMLRAMVKEHEAKGELNSLPKLRSRIRTLEQQIRYMS